MRNDYDTLIRASLLKANQIQYYRPSDKLEDVKYSDKYLKSINDIIDRFDTSYPSEHSDSIRRSRKHKAFIMAASVFIAVALSISSLISFSPVVRAAVLNWLSNITDNIASYTTLGNDLPVSSLKELESEIISHLEIPDGYTLNDSFSSHDLGYLIYKSADGNSNLTIQYMSIASHSTMDVSSENMLHSKVTVHDQDADLYISSDDTGNTLVWADESLGWIFCIDGYLTGDQLVKIADSIY